MMFGLKAMQERLRKAFSQIKEEMNDHLTAINENTNEIQANYEQLCAVEMKVDKLNERLDEIQMMISSMGDQEAKVIEDYAIRPLSKRERDVFIALRDLQARGDPTYSDVARRCGMTQALIVAYLTSMLQKGVPLIKRYVNNVPCVAIDERFMEFQKRTNIIGLEEPLKSESSDQF